MLNKSEPGNFKRYSTQKEFELKLEKETYKSTLLNYGCDGVNVRIYNVPQIAIGSHLDIQISDPQIEFEGEIAGIKQLPSAIEVEVTWKSNIKGLLKEFRLSDILIGLQRKSKT